MTDTDQCPDSYAWRPDQVASVLVRELETGVLHIDGTAFPSIRASGSLLGWGEDAKVQIGLVFGTLADLDRSIDALTEMRDIAARSPGVVRG